MEIDCETMVFAGLGHNSYFLSHLHQSCLLRIAPWRFLEGGWAFALIGPGCSLRLPSLSSLLTGQQARPPNPFLVSPFQLCRRCPRLRCQSLHCRGCPHFRLSINTTSPISPPVHYSARFVAVALYSPLHSLLLFALFPRAQKFPSIVMGLP
jgi:hypothetical protein